MSATPCAGFVALVNGGDFVGSYCCACGEKKADHQAVIIKGSPCDKWEEAQAAQHAPFIYIMSCGSRWAGEEPGDIADLLGALKSATLDPKFEKYGNFINTNPCDAASNPKWGYGNNEPKWIDGKPLYAVPGVYRFFGNFLDLSHVFSIDTNDAPTIRALTAAIEANIASEAYQEARKPRQKKAA